MGSFAQSSARIEETLSEADFYLEQGLFDEAERIYQSVLVIVPSHPKAMLRLGELEAKRGGKGKGKRAAAEPAKLADPLGDTMVREPNGDEALSIPEMPEPATPAKPKKEAPKPAPSRSPRRPRGRSRSRPPPSR